MTELIGKSFKRNVYGPSLWTDIITEVKVMWNIPGSLTEYKGYQIPRLSIKGTEHWFSLDEIIIIRPLDFGQKLQRNKQELHNIIQEEWINKRKFNQELSQKPLNSIKKEDLAI